MATTITTVPASGKIILTLPSVMSVSTSSSLSCTFILPSSLGTVTCSNTGTVITVTLGSTSLSAGFFQLNIAKVVNPPSATLTSTFTLQTQSSSGGALDSQTSNIYLQATAGSLTSFTLTPFSNVVGESTVLKITITIANKLLSGGMIKVAFPKWNPNALISTDIQSMIGTSSPTIQPIQNLQSTAVASFASDVLTVSGGVSSDLLAGSIIIFNVTQFTNPISTATTSGFTATTTDSSGGSIDSLTTTLRVTTPAVIYSTSFVSKTTTIVQTQNSFRLQFYIPVPLNSGCIIDVQFPSDFTPSGATLTSVIGLGLFGGSRTLTGSLNAGNNTYTITDGCQTYVGQNLVAILDFSTISNPFTIKTTGSISIYVKDSSQFAISQITSGVTYTATTGSLTGVTLTPDSNVVSALTSVSITFLPTHQLTAGTSQMSITLPSDASIADQSSTSTCSVSNLSYISSSVTCTVLSNVITLINPFTSAYAPSSTQILGFKISGFTMPPSTKLTGAVVITTKVSIDSALYSVDTASNVELFRATIGTITSASVVPTSLVAYTTTTYTFTFVAQHAILQNGYFIISIPGQITIPSTSSASSSCTSKSGFLSSITCSVSSSTITVSNGFSTGNVVGGTSISFSIAGILNPVSTATTSSFSITTYDSTNNQIDEKISGITVVMTSVNQFTSVGLTLGSYVNGATNTYTFTFVASSPISDGNYILITVPSSVTPPTSPTCTGIQKLSSSLTCTTSNRDIYITLSFSSGSKVDPGTQFAFTISNFVNPKSTLPSDAFAISALDSAKYNINIYTTGTAIKATTTTAASITVATITNNNQYPSQLAAFTITFTTIYSIPVNGIIILTYPSQVQPYDSTVTTVTCSVNIAYAATCAHNSATRTITISNIVTVIPIVGGTSIQITLNEMKNPSTSTASDSFTISTYQVSSGTNYIIDSISTGLTVKSNCNYPCKTCNSATPSTCASCLTDSSGNQLLLQTSTVSGSSVTTCVSACNTDYANVNGVCQPCQANCGACLSTNLSSCTQCGKSAALFLAGTKCTNTCPDGTYGNTSNNNCDSCIYPCETCTSATSCLTCAKLDSSGNTSTLIKLQGTQCLASCTANTYVDVSNVCTACSTNCKYCSQSTTICTACNSPSVLDNTDKTCKSSCPSGTTIYNSSTGACDLCNTNCATCTGSINTCATCAYGLVITTSNTCSTSCLTTAEYINSSNRCVNCGTGCKSCSTTSTYCDKCITNYLFSNFTCVTSCPSGFTIDSTDKTRCVLAGLQCAFGYKIDASGTACEPSSVVCNSGYTLNSEKTKCIPEPGPIAPFPFLIAYAIFIVVILIGYIKNRAEMITTCLIKGIAILEIPYYIIQIYSAAYISSWGIMIGTIIALIILIVCNIVFYIVYLLYVVKDHAFKHWKDKYKCTSRTISITSLIVNFKLFRSFYSKFYGLNTFHAPFEKSTIFYRPFVIMNIIYMLLCLTPIIIVDIVAFYFIQWGYQLLIVAIESFIFSIALIILSLFEFFRIKKRFFSDEDDSYLAINPKMFDNAYTVAGGIPRDSHPKTTINKQRGVPKFEDSQNVFLNNSYSYNKDMKYNDATNLSSIGIISRLYGGKGTMDDESKARNLNLHTIINKMHGDSTLIARSAINVMDLKDNQIFKKRRDYDKNTRLDDEDNFDRFDRKYLRRCESFEDFREIDATFAPDKKELLNEKCISFPPSPRSMEKLDRYMYLDEADFRDKMKAEFSYNNLYADKSRSGYGERSLNRLRELGLNQDLDPDVAQSILDGVLENISGDEDGQFMKGGKKYGLSKKRMMEIPDFEIEDIMGEFDIDDQGNYIILRNDDNGNLEDKNEKRVNRRGYLVDKQGNIIDRYGNFIFKENELDSDDEIPPPYSFEKRKMQLLSHKPDELEDFRLENIVPEEDDQTWLKHKRKELADTMSGEETPVESLVEESPGRYLSDKMSKKSKQTKTNKTINEDNINIDIISQKETVKFDSTYRPESTKLPHKSKRLISARVKEPKNEFKPERIFDGFVRDTPVYFNQIPAYPDLRRISPKRRKIQKKGHQDSYLNRVYGNIDPFLYKDESTLSGIRLDKVVNLKDKKYATQMHLAESAEVETKYKYDGTDEELDSEINRFSGLDRIPSKYKDKGMHRDSSMKNRLNELEDIYTSKMKQKENEMLGRKTQYNSRVKHIGYKNTSTITRNMFNNEKSIESEYAKQKRKKTQPDSKPGEYVLKHRKLEDGGWV